MLEFAMFAGVFFTLLFGVLDFTLAYFQWNAATKAVQYGVRLAAVSDPVVPELQTINGVDWADGIEPGDEMQPFSASCSGATQSCTCTGLLPADCQYSTAAMRKIVYGRMDQTACGGSTPIGMCNFFVLAPLTPANVVIEYRHTGLGYAGRPRAQFADCGSPEDCSSSSAVPTIGIRLTGVNFRFYFLGGLMGFDDMEMPGLLSTATGEDLSGQ